MKIMLILTLALLISACSSSGGASYSYCDADVVEPEWYSLDSAKGYYTAVVKTNHTAGIENEINQLVRVAIGQQIYTEISSESTLTKTNGNSDFKFTYSTRSATNLMLPNTRIERQRVGKCMVAFGSISPDRVEQSIRRKEAMDKMEREEWTQIDSSMDIRDYRRHIQRFPDGRYRELAERNIQYLRDNPPNAIVR